MTKGGLDKKTNPKLVQRSLSLIQINEAQQSQHVDSKERQTQMDPSMGYNTDLADQNSVT